METKKSKKYLKFEPTKVFTNLDVYTKLFKI